MMNDPGAPEIERFLACVVLTIWGGTAGYEAVIRAAKDPKNTPWYDFSIDRCGSTSVKRRASEELRDHVS
ncbi:hypothetical protein [Streptomyces sp. NPDC101206]|uniref:hypothetical protein n=1 Tax=Streptomyces sp. NPDC101206 TaxID=3366128 RepID=UPI0038298862